MHLKICPKYAKNRQIQTETDESLFNDSHRFLKLHMVGVNKKNMLFNTLHKPYNQGSPRRGVGGVWPPLEKISTI